MYRQGSSEGGREAYVEVRGWRGEESLRELFKAYYALDPPLVLPGDIIRREFAFQPFGLESYVRHLSFKDETSLRAYIKSKTPKHAYHSVAIYELPEAPSMEEKGWLGSDLLFDLDLDHPGLCGSQVIDDHCLVEGFKKAQFIAKVVTKVLGGRASVYFTGHRGFHVRGKCEECLTLGRDERREIAKFVRAEGLDLSYLLPVKVRGGVSPAPPSPEDPGWRGLIAEALGGSPKLRARDLKELPVSLGIDIDLMVTEDPTRLTRIPGTLNAKGTLMVTPLCNSFSPGPQLSPFRGELEARALRPLEQTKVLGFGIGLAEGEELSLPASVALYLWSAGLVELERGEVVVRRNTGWWPVQGCNWEP